MKKGRLFRIVGLSLVLTALLLVGCQRSAHPPVYEVEVSVVLADWPEAWPGETGVIVHVVKGRTVVVWERRSHAPMESVFHFWLEEGNYYQVFAWAAQPGRDREKIVAESIALGIRSPNTGPVDLNLWRGLFLGGVVDQR